MTNSFRHLRHACIHLHSISSVLKLFYSPLAPDVHQAWWGVINHVVPIVIATCCYYMQQTLTCMSGAAIHANALCVATLYGIAIQSAIVHTACLHKPRLNQYRCPHGSIRLPDAEDVAASQHCRLLRHITISSWLQRVLPPHCRTVVLCRWTVQGRTFPAASLQWTSPRAPPVKYAPRAISLLQQRACVCLDHTSISTGTACACLTPKATPC